MGIIEGRDSNNTLLLKGKNCNRSALKQIAFVEIYNLVDYAKCDKIKDM